MPKLTKDFSLHLTAALYAAAEERRKALGLSMNAYIALCIQAEKDAADKCNACAARTVYKATGVILEAYGLEIPEAPKKGKR